MEGESRLDFLEGRVEEQSRNWDRLFSETGRIDQKIDAVGATLSVRFDGRMETIEQKFDRKVDDLRADLLKQYRWTIGVMVSLSMGLLTAILTR